MFDDVHPGDPIPKLAAFWNNLKAAVAARRAMRPVPCLRSDWCPRQDARAAATPR